MRAAFPIAIGAACTLTIYGQGQTAAPKLDPDLRAFLQRQFAQDDGPGSETQAAVATTRLSTGGAPVVVVYLMSSGWCGSGGCTLAVIQSKGGSFQVLSRTPIVELPVKVLPSRTNGWNDLAVRTGAEPGLGKLVFNGEGYQGNPSMGTRVPASQGTVLISENDRGEPLTPLSPSANAARSTGSNDAVLFKCVTGAKEAYLYARGGQSGQASGVQYVALANGKPEFTYPTAPDLTGSVFHFSRRGYAGGGEYHITFRNGSYTYVAYDKTTTADNGSLPDFRSGIIVLQNGKVIANRRCRDDPSITSSARTYLKGEPFVDVPGIP